MSTTTIPTTPDMVLVQASTCPGGDDDEEEIETYRPGPIESLSAWQSAVAAACDLAKPCAAMDLRDLEHDRRVHRGLWIQALRLCRVAEDTFRVAIEYILDNRDAERHRYELVRALHRDEVAPWYLHLSHDASACLDCGVAIIPRTVEVCPKCTFDHIRMGENDCLRTCSLCFKTAGSRLTCGHAVHHKCFRVYSRTQDDFKCPLCRSPLTPRDEEAFVSSLMVQG